MNKFFVASLASVLSVCAMAAEKPTPKLVFDASKGVAGSVILPTGKKVNYTAYTKLYYVTNVEDSTYQYLNLFVPDGATQKTPIFMPNYVGGYMAAEAKMIDEGDASGRALAEGYVVVIPGVRGRNSVVSKKRKTVYTGRAPKGLLDLKAAVRYLRHFDREMPGDAERIITDGTSAGGAMSSLLGTSGNNPSYQPMLNAMGAADERDDIFAAVCFCPIVDLDHADMAYEWLYGVTNNHTRPVSNEQVEVSKELASLYPAYINSLNLKKPDGTSLNADNYRDYLKQLLIASAQEAKDAGADIPDSIGFSFSSAMKFAAPVNGGKKQTFEGKPKDMKPQGKPMDMPKDFMLMMAKRKGEYVTGLDLDKYLAYVSATTPLKSVPAFDSKGVAGSKASGENEEFGDDKGSAINFTDFALRKATGKNDATVSRSVSENVRLLNPMRMMDEEGSTLAPHWYIRHGAIDRDTAFPVPVNLATKLENKGKDVNFKLPWNRPHSGDYALNELFSWIKSICR